MQLVLHGRGRFSMSCKPLNYLGPLRDQKLLVCGVGAEALGFAWGGADVYGFDSSPDQVQGLKDLARQLGLRDRTHFQPMLVQQLAYPDDYFDLVFAQSSLKGSLERALRKVPRGGARGRGPGGGGGGEEPGRRGGFPGHGVSPFPRGLGGVGGGGGW